MIVDTPTINAVAYGSSTSAIDAGAWQQFANGAGAMNAAGHISNQIVKSEKQVMAARRLVKVAIVDPNENVPLSECVLYSGEEKLTDATDQELFFEIDIKSILDKHNAKRVKCVDRKVKDRTEYLEPAKIRDLKMVVVNVAMF